MLAQCRVVLLKLKLLLNTLSIAVVEANMLALSTYQIYQVIL